MENENVLVTYTDFYPMEQGVLDKIKEIPKAKIKENIVDTVSVLLDALNEIGNKYEEHLYQVEEVSAQLAISSEGKISFVAFNANSSISTLFDVKIKRKDLNQ